MSTSPIASQRNLGPAVAAGYLTLLALQAVPLVAAYLVVRPAAGSILNGIVGTVGLLCMIGMHVYSVARRSARLRRWLRLSWWLHLHIFLGLQGILLAYVHCPHEPLGECSQCHTALSWSEGRFDHARAAFVLDGAHLSVSCDRCHAEGFRGVPNDCAGCHAAAGERAHGEFGPCETCHATMGFAPSSFDHAAVSFPLTGRHASAPCASCHEASAEGYPRR